VNRPLRTTSVVAATTLVLGAAAAAAVGFTAASPATPTTIAVGARTATAQITRATLTQTQEVNGVLGYGTPVTVNARGQGIITWLPASGATLRRGKAVYKLDNIPVPLLYGNLPLYRELRPGLTGPDVKEVERNLAALGYTGFTVDTRYTAATATAVRRWQQAAGRAQTGAFDPAGVVIARGPVRVVSLTAHLGDPVGDPAGGAVLAYAGTTKVVRVNLDTALQDMARVGRRAVITLPDGRTVNGKVAAVGTVATSAQDQSQSQGGQNQNQNEPATIEVTVTVADQSKFGRLDQAPVVVQLTSASVENVLTVPVSALVALAEGGYGVQVVTGSASRYVAVEPGMFAGGRVEVSGDGLSEGMLVGVPS
jgi:peptidoglycan hydrolase-like protein with peptidoglycan-binding domain